MKVDLKYLPDLIKTARSLVRNFPSEDHRDLVQDTLVKLMSMPEKEINGGYVNSACRSLWKDKQKKAIVRAICIMTDKIDEYSPVCWPDTVERIECEQIGKQWDDWPERYSSKRIYPEP
jgi:hypothetical protein